MRLLLDTPLLLLHVAGRADVASIKAHRRLHPDYDTDDFRLLQTVVDRYEGLVLTPNTMTETSNWISYIRDPFLRKLRQELKSVSQAAPEVVVLSKTAAADADYAWLGLTDAAILTALDQQTAVLTSDFNLFRVANARGFTAMNFQHLRDTTFE